MVTQDVVHRAGKTLPMAEKVWEAGAERTIVVPIGDGSEVTMRPTDRLWSEIERTSPDEADTSPVHVGPADRYSNVLFSSGTTGRPKAIPWTHTTPIKAAMDGRKGKLAELGNRRGR